MDKKSRWDDAMAYGIIILFVLAAMGLGNFLLEVYEEIAGRTRG